jgi:hypothetical protein
MIRQSQVIIGREVNHFSTIEPQRRSLVAFHAPEFTIQPRIFNAE